MLYKNFKYAIRKSKICCTCKTFKCAVWKFQISFSKISITQYKNFNMLQMYINFKLYNIWSTGLPTNNEILMTTLILWNMIIWRLWSLNSKPNKIGRKAARLKLLGIIKLRKKTWQVSYSRLVSIILSG